MSTSTSWHIVPVLSELCHSVFVVANHHTLFLFANDIFFCVCLELSSFSETCPAFPQVICLQCFRLKHQQPDIEGFTSITL
ncbi:hypothetical protein NQZ68_026043 [Dissostichus eleginoides]|nr:hypothetical protein NQZ68_026043 [Dissostichus eleginoides]